MTRQLSGTPERSLTLTLRPPNHRPFREYDGDTARPLYTNAQMSI